MPNVPMPAANGRPKLRVAIVSEGKLAPCWIVESFSLALDSPKAELVGVYRLANQTPAVWAERLFHHLDRLDGRVMIRNKPSPYETDIAAAFGARQLGRLTATKLDGTLALDDVAIGQLRDQRLDLVLCCVSAPFALQPTVSRFGLWGLEMGFGVAATAPWAGAAELARQNPLTLIRIVDYSKAIDRELYVSTSGAFVGSSVRRNRLRALAGSGAVIRRLLDGLDNESERCRPAPRLLPLPAKCPQQPEPTIGLLANTCFRMVSTPIRSRLRRNARDDFWHIAYAFTDLALPQVAFDRLRYLAPPPGRFWADPFPLIYQGRNYIFFEELSYRTWLGRLLVLEVFEDGPATAPVTVLERHHHLSYPHVFEWQGRLYMVPETRSARRVELWRCVEFPSRWELCKILVDDVRAVDATLWYRDRTWWMFVGVAPASGAIDELHLYYADSLDGEWLAHPGNPVCTDVRCARPGGPLFESAGKLFRPSQDSARCYGHALWINEVEQLDRNGYRERSIMRIAPDWHPDIRCVHTLGRSGRLTVIDCVVDDRGGLEMQHHY